MTSRPGAATAYAVVIFMMSGPPWPSVAIASAPGAAGGTAPWAAASGLVTAPGAPLLIGSLCGGAAGEGPRSPLGEPEGKSGQAEAEPG